MTIGWIFNYHKPGLIYSLTILSQFLMWTLIKVICGPRWSKPDLKPEPDFLSSYSWVQFWLVIVKVHLLYCSPSSNMFLLHSLVYQPCYSKCSVYLDEQTCFSMMEVHVVQFVVYKLSLSFYSSFIQLHLFQY